MRQNNIFPLTKEEILENFPHVFKNQFQSRTIVRDHVWETSIDENHFGFFGGYTKGVSTSAMLIDKNGEIDHVEFWQQIKHGRIQYCYSFKKRN